MKFIFVMLCIASSARASLTLSSASVGSDGMSFTVLTNSSTTLTGSTSGCFTTSGGSNALFTQIDAATVSGTSITVVTDGPAYHGETVRVALVANPTCALSGSTGNAAAGTVTATNGSDYYPCGDAHWTGLLTFQGSVSIQNDGRGNPNVCTFTSANASIDMHLASSSGTIAVWTFNFGAALSLIVDGAITSRSVLSTGTVYSETAFTVDPGNHVFRIAQSGSSVTYPYFEAVRCPGCTFLTPPAVRPIFGECGSSVVDIVGDPSGGSATTNADQTHYALLGAAFGATAQGFSSAGQNLFTTLRDTCPSAMQPLGGAHPVFSFMEPDSNDVAHSVALSDYQSAGQTTTTNIMAAAAHPVKLFWLSPNISANSNTSIGNCPVSVRACYASYTAALAAGVAAAADPNTVFVHTVALPNGGPDRLNSACFPTANADMQSDCNHPNAATAMGQPGYGKFANREAPIAAGQFLGQSFVVTGPTTDRIGGVSTPFTSTIGGAAASATWMDIVTVSSSESSDRLCIVGGACATGSISLPASLGLSAWQFTVGTSTEGARTLSFSNMPEGWIAPPALTLTATASPNTSHGLLMGRLK
jgi:hypothetical protein